MKKKICLWIALWMACLVGLGLYYVFFAERQESVSEAENRTLAAFPALSGESLFSGSFGRDMETWLLDRFPARDAVIALVNHGKAAISLASHEEYLAVAQDPDDKLDESEFQDDVEALLVQTTPRPTPMGTPVPMPIVTLGPTEEPKPTEYPPIVPKPQSVLEDFPEKLSVIMNTGEEDKAVTSYRAKNVMALTQLLNQYAGLLPENGKLLFTVVPHSSAGIRFVKAKEKVNFYSEWDEAVNAWGADNVFAFDTAEILCEPIQNGEYVYFRQDLHWHPYGTWLVYRQMAAAAGKEPADYYEDFDITIEEPFRGTYYRDNPSAYAYVEPDRLDLLSPKFPLEWRRITAPDEYQLIDFLNFKAPRNDRYCVYLGGPAGPWTYAECDNGQEENCLIITDSFGLAFVPMLTQNYRQVHYYDPRHFNARKAGGSVSELIEKYDIQDIYVVVADQHSFHSGFLMSDARSHLGLEE